MSFWALIDLSEHPLPHTHMFAKAKPLSQMQTLTTRQEDQLAPRSREDMAIDTQN